MTIKDYYLTGCEIENLINGLPGDQYHRILRTRMRLGIGELPASLHDIARRVELPSHVVEQQLHRDRQVLRYLAEKYSGSQ